MACMLMLMLFVCAWWGVCMCVWWGFFFLAIHRQFVRPAVEARPKPWNSWSPSMIDKRGGENFISP